LLTLSAGLSLNNTAVANALDLGDPISPYGSVHPRNKQEVARRFLLAALGIIYRRDTQYRSPMYKAAAAEAGGTHLRVRVFFDEQSLSGGALQLRPQACPLNVSNATECSWNEVQTDDGAWHNATTSLTPDAKGLYLDVELPPTVRVNATRGTWSPWPVAHVYSQANGLPALPWWAPVDQQQA
jgi:hypothetical protein